jgi:hypothetical protein
MSTRIVTYAHRPKRQPRKRNAIALQVPAIVAAGRRSRSEMGAPPPTNDDNPREAAPPATKSAIVTTAHRKRTKLLRTDKPQQPDDAAADAAMRAWIERAKWGRG